MPPACSSAGRPRRSLVDSGFGVFSTAISGFSNVVVQIVAASALAVSQFALFSLAAATIILVLGASRAIIAQTDMLRGLSGRDNGSAAAATTASAICVVGGLPTLIAGLAFGATIAVIGCGLLIAPVFIFQDALRFRAFRTRRARIAFGSDSASLVVSCAGLAIAAPELTAGSALVCWGVGTAVGLVVGAVPLDFRPVSPRLGWAWLSDHRDLALPAAGEYSLQAALPYIVNFLMLALSTEALAGYRLGQLLFAAVGNLAVGLDAVLLPSIVETRSPRRAINALGVSAVSLTLAGVALSALIVGLPSAVGLAALGTAWIAMQPFVLVCSVHALGNALAVPVVSLTRLLGLATYSFIVRVLTVVASVLATAFAVAQGDPVLVAWGLAIPAILAYGARATRVIARVIGLSKTNRAIP